MLVARAYFLKRAQCAWARPGARASFSGDHGMMPPVSLPWIPERTPMNHANTAVASTTVRVAFIGHPLKNALDCGDLRARRPRRKAGVPPHCSMRANVHTEPPGGMFLSFSRLTLA